MLLPNDSQKIAATVIAKADRDHPADAVLKAELKAAHGVTPGVSRATSEAVFAYYRWRGWLNPQASRRQQITQAFSLNERFASQPSSFREEDLCQKAIPAWVSEQLDVSPAWLQSLQKEPVLWLRARPGQGPALAQELGDCRLAGEGWLSDCLGYTGRRDLFRAPEFHAGQFEVQDLGSQWVGWLCQPQPGETWWDACAGEGGKTLHWSDLMRNQGLIWASDRAAWRLQRLKRRAARARIFNYRAMLWNGERKLPTRTRFDGVLVDAPCSGLGTWQRNPHARWTTTPADVRELAAVQKQLLLNVAPSVKPGGKLIYAVCTLTKSETVDVVKSVEAQWPDFEPLPVADPLRPHIPPSAQLWLWPQTLGSNAMFIAIWQRKKHG